MFMVESNVGDERQPRFERAGPGYVDARDSLLQSVGDVREVMFVLLDRARELRGRETTIVDALQLVANDLGMVESMLRSEGARPAA